MCRDIRENIPSAQIRPDVCLTANTEAREGFAVLGWGDESA